MAKPGQICNDTWKAISKIGKKDRKISKCLTIFQGGAALSAKDAKLSLFKNHADFMFWLYVMFNC